MPIVTLAQAKKHLNKTSEADNDEIQMHIDAARVVVEDYIGPVVSSVKTERHPAGRVLVLDSPPVLTLTSVTPWLTGGTTYDVSDLKVDKASGVVERLDGGCFTGGPFEVVYDAGRSEPYAENIQLASLIIIKHTWETQRGQMNKLPVGGGVDNVPVPTGISYAVPRRALELLRPQATAPTIA